MGVLPTMRSDKSEILPYNFKDYYAFIGLEKLSDHPSFRGVAAASIAQTQQNCNRPCRGCGRACA